MDHVAPMGILGRVGQDGGDLGGLADRHGPEGQTAVQAPALDKFEGAERGSLVFAEIKDLHDVGVLQAGGRLGLAAKARRALRGQRPAGVDHLQGHGALQLGVESPVDHAHPAASDLGHDLIAAETFGKLVCGRCPGRVTRRGRGSFVRARPQGDDQRVVAEVELVEPPATLVALQQMPLDGIGLGP